MRDILLLAFSASLIVTPLHAAKDTAQKHQTPFKMFTGKVIGNKVRLRLSPNLEGHIVKEAQKGEIFKIVGENQEYYAVAPPKDIKAYIFRTHVLDGAIEGHRVNVRLSPDLDAPILTQLNSGESVHIKSKNNRDKWLEIEPPKSVHLWIAKDYVNNIGPASYAEKFQERRQEATQLLATANLIAEAEFRKKFQEIDLSRVTRNYERLLSDYHDMDAVADEAKLAIQNLQKEYCDKKIAFLESKAGRAALEVQTLNAKLTNLKTTDIDQPVTPQTIQEPFRNLVTSDKITDKMKVWQPYEFALYQSWAMKSDKENADLKQFYQEQFLDAKVLQGIVESFDGFIKNKPGDYLLKTDKGDNVYLYSTHINLQDYVGKRVSLKVKERDNHLFAFPAYYVLEAKEN